MLHSREEDHYRPVDPSVLPKDNIERVYLEHEAKEDALEYTKFDIKPPADCHTSTVAYLERTYEVSLEYYDTRFGIYAPLSPTVTMADGGAVMQGGDMDLEINSPGFTLQNTCKEVTVNFGTTTITDKPSLWVPQYTHLYPQCLKRFVRNSGREFALHRRMDEGYTFPGIRERMINLTTMGYHTPRTGPMPALDDLRPPPNGYFVRLYAMTHHGSFYLNNNDQFIAHKISAYHPNEQLDINLAQGLQGIFNYFNSVGLTTLTNIITQANIHATFAALDPATLTEAQLAKKNETLTAYNACNNWSDALTNIKANIELFPRSLNVWQLDIENYPLRYISHTGQHGRYSGDFSVGPNQPLLAFDFNLITSEQASHNADNTWQFMSESRLGAGPDYLKTYLADPNIATNDVALLDSVNAGTARQAFQVAFTDGMYLQTMYYILYNLCEITVDEVGGHVDLLRQDVLGLPPGQVEPWRTFFEMFVEAHYERYRFIVAYGARDDNNEILVPPGTEPFRQKTEQSRLELKFVEPLIIAHHKPGEAFKKGCWSQTGDIIPRVGRYKYHFSWEDQLGRRLLNAHQILNFREEARFTCTGVIGKTKLHTIHYRGLLKPRKDLYVHDFRYQRLGYGSMDQDTLSKTTEFKIFLRTRPEPLFMLFFTKVRYDVDEDMLPDIRRQYYHHGPVITGLTLHTNTKRNVITYKNAEARLAAFTSNHYPEYKHLVDHFGGCVAIPYSALPRSVYESGFDDELSGSITTRIPDAILGEHMEQIGLFEIEYEVAVVFVYKDYFITINDNSVQRVLDL